MENVNKSTLTWQKISATFLSLCLIWRLSTSNGRLLFELNQLLTLYKIEQNALIRLLWKVFDYGGINKASMELVNGSKVRNWGKKCQNETLDSLESKRAFLWISLAATFKAHTRLLLIKNAKYGVAMVNITYKNHPFGLYALLSTRNNRKNAFLAPLPTKIFVGGLKMKILFHQKPLGPSLECHLNTKR